MFFQQVYICVGKLFDGKKKSAVSEHFSQPLMVFFLGGLYWIPSQNMEWMKPNLLKIWIFAALLLSTRPLELCAMICICAYELWNVQVCNRRPMLSAWLGIIYRLANCFFNASAILSMGNRVLCLNIVCHQSSIAHKIETKPARFVSCFFFSRWQTWSQLPSLDHLVIITIYHFNDANWVKTA